MADMTVERPDTTVYIASINTAWNTELCLRSLQVRDAGHHSRVVVGDCGSTDRTLPMLVRLARGGVVDEIELAPRGRTHATWIDHWLSTCPTDYMVLLDSDVEIRLDGWLADLHRARSESDAVFVTAMMEEERREITRPGVTMSKRPTVYCMLLDVANARAVGRSFEEWYDGGIGYDVAAWFFSGVVDAKIPYVVMPEDWLPAVKHYEAMSYGKEHDLLRNQVRRNELKVMVRVLFYRAGGSIGANALILWRDVRARATRFNKARRRVRAA
ncbi:MAG TPA: glycosyltransferase [Acidimicrobiales bacterium]|nr:glycosyltransferase [Acidimicrobiales bacterium]